MSRRSSGASQGGLIPSRLYFIGHSYNAYRPNPYGDYVANDVGRPRSVWSKILPDLLGVDDRDQVLQMTVPPVAITTDTTTVIGVVPEEAIIEAVYYLPLASVTGANTNSRTLQLLTNGPLGPGVVMNFPLTTGNNLVSPADTLNGTPIGLNTLLAPNQIYASKQLIPHDGTTAYVVPGPSWNAPGTGVLRGGTVLEWKSLHVGTGIVDPGGVVVVRLGTRVRNVSVSGSSITASGVFSGGWATAMALRSLPAWPGSEVNVSATANAGATSISCDALPFPVFSGNAITFTNGVVATPTANSLIGAAAITVSALSGQVPAGEQGSFVYDAVVPTQTWCILTGINDTVNPDASAFRETMRALLAHACSPYWTIANASNNTYVNGGGTWAVLAGAKPGQVPMLTGSPTAIGKIFTGAATGNPSITIKVAAGAMDGDTINLFFWVPQGSSHGAQASITVDGANPPSGVCTINTHNVSTALTGTMGVSSVTATTTNASTAAVATVGTFNDPHDIGRLVTGPGVAANTVIASVTDSTHAVLSQNAGAGAGSGTLTMLPFIPMVKRLTGLTRAANHTIVVTLTGIDATDGTACLIYGGYGIESDTPRAPVAVANIARILSQAAGPDANVVALNAELTAVLAGTATVLSGNSVEPAFTSNVKLIDIDSILNKQTSLYAYDGIHPNARSHPLIAQAFANAIRGMNQQAVTSR